MKASDFIGSRYLSAADVDGQPIDGEIVEVGSERCGTDRPRNRLIIKLDSCAKPIVLNATNTTELKSAWGDETDEWLGKHVSVGTHKVRFAGKQVDGLVVKPLKGGAA